MSDWCRDSSYMLARSLRRKSMTFMHKSKCSINRALLIQESDHYWVKTRHENCQHWFFLPRLTFNTVWHCQCHCIFHEVKNVKLKFQHETKASSHLPHNIPCRARSALKLLQFPFVENLEDFQWHFRSFPEIIFVKKSREGNETQSIIVSTRRHFFLFFFRVMGNDVIGGLVGFVWLGKFMLFNLFGGVEAFLLRKANLSCFSVH